jgi:hypothetical protein
MKLMILTSDPDFAVKSQEAGIERIFFDLEYLNKADRQRGRDTVLSANNIDDIPKIRKVINGSELLVRINMINPYTKDEVEKVIEYGADIIMLPMAMDANDAKTLVEYVGGRAKVCIMIETPQSLTRIDDILNVSGVDELFIGLNDMHIGLGLNFMFEVLSGGLVEYLAEKCNKKGIPFGFGGIARIGDGMLPAEKILGEHIRLGSTSVILSRTFKNSNINDLNKEVNKVKYEIENIRLKSKSELLNNRDEIKSIVNKIISK